MRAFRERGTSLVELLVSMLLLGLFTGVLYQFCRAMLRGVRVLEVASEAQEAARIGMELMVRDLRGAGFSPHRTIAAGVGAARRDAVAMVSDLNGDGDTDDRNEAVAYALDHAQHALTRTMGDAPPQPMLADIAPDGLEFTYIGEDGVAIPLVDGAVDAADRPRIRRVDITLSIQIPHPDPAYAVPIRCRQIGSAWLRNGP